MAQLKRAQQNLYIQETDKDLDLFEEQNLLKRALTQTNCRRFGNQFYSMRNGLKREYSLREFAWCFCSQPKYANEMTKWIEHNVVDCKQVLRMFAKGNRQFKSKHVYDTWGDALGKVFNERSKPAFEYTSDVLGFDPTTNMYTLNGEDGDFLNGLIIAKSLIGKLESVGIKFKFDFEDDDRFTFDCEYELDQHALHDALANYEYDDAYVLTPFKHPVPMFNLKGDIKICAKLKPAFEDYKITRYAFTPIVSIVNEVYRTWMSENVFKFTMFVDGETGESETYVYKAGYVSEDDTIDG